MAEVGGVLTGIQGARQAKNSFRNQRDAIRTSTLMGTGEIEERMKALQDNPLLQGVNQQQQRELQFSPDAQMRQGLFNQAAADIQGLGGQGLSNPAVQDQIFRQTLEQSILPDQQRAEENLSSQLAARGLGRSGQAVGGFTDLATDFGNRIGDTRRQIATQGAQEAFNEQLTRAQASQDLFNTGAQVASQVGQNAAGIGLQQEGFMADLAKFIAQLRQQAELSLLGQAPSPGSMQSNALFKGAEIFNQGLGGAFAGGG